jgi:hypothetical protein
VDISPTALIHATTDADLVGRVTWAWADLITTPPPVGVPDLVSIRYFPLPHQSDHTALRRLLATVASGGPLLLVTHDLAGLSHAPASTRAVPTWCRTVSRIFCEFCRRCQAMGHGGRPRPGDGITVAAFSLA